MLGADCRGNRYSLVFLVRSSRLIDLTRSKLGVAGPAVHELTTVDEADLGTLAVGDLVPVTLDMQPDHVLMATVTRISALGVSRQNAAYFTVRASLPAGSGLLGASASMYLPAAKE